MIKIASDFKRERVIRHEKDARRIEHQKTRARAGASVQKAFPVTLNF